MFGRAVGRYKKVKASREALAKELQVTLGMGFFFFPVILFLATAGC